jgi:hypothetical protein
MTRTRLVLCLALIGAMGACGGRSGLRLSTHDGGEEDDGGSDARSDGGGHDGRFDGGFGSDASYVAPSDASVDVAAADARIDVAAADARIDVAAADARVDVVASDARAEAGTSEVRVPDAASDVRAEVGGPDVPRDGAIDVPVTDGRPDVSTPIDRPRDITPDTVVVTLSSIEISSTSSPIVVNVGTPVPFTVTAIYSDSTRQDVTSSATVTSSNTAALTISGTNLVGAGTADATATITATYQGQTATAPVTIHGNNPLVSISIDQVPTSPLAIGQTVNLKATGVFADGSKQDVTAQATWASSAATVATVGNTGTTKGQVTGVAAGSFTVTATVGTIVGTSSQMTVSGTKKLVSIQITPSQPTIQQGRPNIPFTATGTYDDNSTGDVTQQATWSSSDISILTVVASGANAGRVTTVAPGQATVTATVGAISGTDAVTVTRSPLRTITVDGPSVLIVNSPRSFTARGIYADGTTADLTGTVTWSSSNSAIVSVSNAAAAPGLATGIAAGTATIRAAFSGVTGQANVTVSAAPLISITVTPNPLNNVIIQLTSALTATGLYGTAGDPTTQFSLDVTTLASWSVADNTIATVGNSTTTAGEVTGVKAGSTTVTATLSGKAGQAVVNVVQTTLVSIAVSPPTASVRAGQTYPFQATGTFDNASTRNITADVTWSSSDATIATVSNAAGTKGVATGVVASATAVTITAVMQGKQGTALLTVTEPRLVSIQIQQTAQTINVGDTFGYTLIGVYENGTTTRALTGVSWTSSDPAVATVAANTGGRGPAAAGATATAVAAGTTTITASYTPSGGTALSDSVALSVIRQPLPLGIRLTPANSSIDVGQNQPYQAFLDYDDGTATPLAGGVTLTTSNGVVASVAGGGRGPGGGGLTVNGLAAGTVTITAAYTTGGTPYTTTAQLTVTLPPVVTQNGLYITPTSASVRVNGTQQFVAHATWSDGTETVVTNDTNCVWTTSNGTLATITTAGTGGGRGGGGGGGLATGLAVGTPTISATYGGFTATAATLTVTAPVLQSLVVAPPTATVHVGQNQAYTATAYYSDGTSTLVTGAATWSTADPNIAVMTVGGGGGRGGPGVVVGGSTATGLAIGTVNINASYIENGISVTGSAPLTVSNPAVLEFHVTPTTPTIYTAISTALNFTATVIYADYTTATVTASTTWSSSVGAVAVISDSGATTGRATGQAAGTTTITGAFGGKTDSTTLTVSTATLTKVDVTPTGPTTHLGINQSFVAVVTLSDSTPVTVTGSSTWMSSDNTVATVVATTGVATPLKAGTTTITASYKGLSGTSNLAVGSGTLNSITITPTPLSVVVGGHQQLTATGTWGDTPPTTADITNNVTWLSSSDATATVSNAAGSRGLFTAVAAGPVTVTAAFQSKTGTLAGTVTTAH